MSAASHPKDDDDDDLLNSSSSLKSGSINPTMSSCPDSCEQSEAAKRSHRYKLAVEVLRNVYHEFWDDHVRLAQEEIDSLNTSSAPLPEESPCITYDDCEAINFEEADRIIVENPFDEREELSYHCGSPASRDMEEQEFLNIKQHTDAPEFSLDEFSLRNKDRDAVLFPWKNVEDLNRDIIDVEVARILHYEHNLTFEEIDELGVLRLSFRGPDDNPNLGLLSINSRLERSSSIRWESSRSVKLQLPRFSTNPNLSRRTLLETLNAGLQYFCADPRCITSHCTIHNSGDIRKRNLQPLKIQEPKETQEGILLKYAKSDPCSKFCFLTHLNEKTTETRRWRVEDEQELRELLAIMPDANPCDLAVMCRKRCYEVYFHRKNIYPDHEILERRYKESLE